MLKASDAPEDEGEGSEQNRRNLLVSYICI